MSSTRNNPQGTILVVDDEDEIVQFVQDALEDEGYTVWSAFDGGTAVKEAREHHPDLVILDIMPSISVPMKYAMRARRLR